MKDKFDEGFDVNKSDIDQTIIKDFKFVKAISFNDYYEIVIRFLVL